mgnify:CR=1 FL=1
MSAVRVNGRPHPADHPLCPQCVIGYPRACVCGGWVHAGGDEGDREPVRACDRCGDDARPAEPFCLAGGSHAPGRADCPACPPGAIAPCRCGGLIHSSQDGDRRCDRCGSRCEDLDV